MKKLSCSLIVSGLVALVCQSGYGQYPAGPQEVSRRPNEVSGSVKRTADSPMLQSCSQQGGQFLELDWAALFPGGIFSAVIEDNTLHCAHAGGYCAYNITDRSSPVKIADVYVPGGRATDIRIAEGTAFLNQTHDKAFITIDISNPYDPGVPVRIPTPEPTWCLAVHDSLLLVGWANNDHAGVQVFCIDGGTVNPTPVSDISLGGVYRRTPLPTGLHVEDTLLFIAACSVKAVSINDLNNPFHCFSSYWEQVYRAYYMLSLGDILMVSGGGFFWLLDVSEGAFNKVYSSEISGFGCQAVALGDMLILPIGEAGLQVYDLEIPSAPELISTYPTIVLTGSVAASEDSVVYAMDWGCFALQAQPYPRPPDSIKAGDVTILDLADPGSPRKIGRIPGGPYITDARGKDGIYYALSNHRFSKNHLITFAGDGTLQDWIELPVGGNTLEMYQDLLLIGTGRGLLLFQLGDLTPEGSIAFAGGTLGIQPIDDSLVFVCSAEAGVHIVDIGNGRVLGRLDTPSRAIQAAVVGDTAYVADMFSLRVIDITDPENPRDITSSYPPVGSTSGVRFEGGFLYVDRYLAANSFGFGVYDLDLELHGSYGGDPVYDMEVLGGYVFLELAHQIAVVNAQNPDSVYLVEIVNVPNLLWDIWVDSTGLLASYGLGLTKYNHPIGNRRRLLPDDFVLLQNYPNPFNSSTTVEFELGGDCHVRLELFNILGQLVDVVAEGWYSKGRHIIQFTPDQRLASGVYPYRLTTDFGYVTNKMVVVK